MFKKLLILQKSLFEAFTTAKKHALQLTSYAFTPNIKGNYLWNAILAKIARASGLAFSFSKHIFILDSSTDIWSGEPSISSASTILKK